MKIVLYRIWQCTYGIIQTLCGFCLYLANIGNDHFAYHGAVVTVWKHGYSASLGMFLFIAENALYSGNTRESSRKMLLVHEYGHTVQSLILGPLYLPLMGLPSFLWASVPYFKKLRREKHISYYSFYTESSANYMGEKTTKERSMGRYI